MTRIRGRKQKLREQIQSQVIQLQKQVARIQNDIQKIRITSKTGTTTKENLKN